MNTLAEYGIESERRKGLTGVWTSAGKIASIGVAVSHWIAYHGIALNVRPDMNHFKLINPCGLVGITMTSMADLANPAPDIATVSETFRDCFCAEFGFDNIRTETAMATPGDAP